MALTYVEDLAANNPHLTETLTNALDLYRKKLYHQLTNLLMELIHQQPEGVNLMDLEKNFIRDFRNKLNWLRYAEMLVGITSQESNIEKCMETLEDGYKASEDDVAKILLQCQMAFFELQNDPAKAKNSLETIQTTINTRVAPPPSVVYSLFHKVFAIYYKGTVDAENFYYHAIRFLSYSNIDLIPDLANWVNDISLAAIVAPKFYDFGELSLHPSMAVLKDGPRAWVYNILQAFIAADPQNYHEFVDKHKSEIEKESILVQNRGITEEKIRLLALVRLAFYKPSFERVLTFEEIARATKDEVKNVEQMVMRSMSLGLLKGTIDEIEKNVSVTFVKPRILDMDEMKATGERLDAWVEKLNNIHKEVEPDIEKLFG